MVTKQDTDASGAYRYINSYLEAFLSGIYTKLLDKEFNVEGLEYWGRAI